LSQSPSTREIGIHQGGQNLQFLVESLLVSSLGGVGILAGIGIAQL